jgi:dodecin
MKDQVFKTIQITGTSTKSSDDAVKTAIDKAGKTIHNLRWFKVADSRGHIEKGKVASWQVTIELGFALE